jgi:hypothetical protein
MPRGAGPALAWTTRMDAGYGGTLDPAHHACTAHTPSRRTLQRWHATPPAQPTALKTGR